jgi:hypothetical protein
MKNNEEEGEKIYTTLDAYQAGFLTLKGHPPKFIEQGDKIVFLFEADEGFYKDLNTYNAGEMVEASRFAMVIKGLKTKIHSMKMNNGKRYVERKKEGG